MFRRHAMTRTRIAALAAAVVTIAGLALPATATATAATPAAVTARTPGPPTSEQVTKGRRALVTARGRHQPTPQTMPNFAGYIDDPVAGKSFRYIASTITIPTVSCSGSEMGSNGAIMDDWVGIGSASLQQAGTEIFCASKTSTPTYKTWYFFCCALGQAIHYQAAGYIHPGDRVKFSVFYNQGTNDYNFESVNNTTGASWTHDHVACPATITCDNNRADALVEDPGGGVAAGFDLAKFTSAYPSGVHDFRFTFVTSLDGTQGTLNSQSGEWTREPAIDMYYQPCDPCLGRYLAEVHNSLTPDGEYFYRDWDSSF